MAKVWVLGFEDVSQCRLLPFLEEMASDSSAPLLAGLTLIGYIQTHSFETSIVANAVHIWAYDILTHYGARFCFGGYHLHTGLRDAGFPPSLFIGDR